LTSILKFSSGSGFLQWNTNGTLSVKIFTLYVNVLSEDGMVIFLQKSEFSTAVNCCRRCVLLEAKLKLRAFAMFIFTYKNII
jgi:hypothetical protein